MNRSRRLGIQPVEQALLEQEQVGLLPCQVRQEPRRGPDAITGYPNILLALKARL